MDQTVETKRELRLQKWEAMYAEYQSSGKTVQAWCAEQGLSVKTFYYRLRRLQEKTLKNPEKCEIVPIEISADIAPVRDNHADNEIKITGNGITIEASGNISSELMMVILKGIQQC